MPVNVWTVTAAAALTALATGLGALPFAFSRGAHGKRWLGTSNAVAAGFMLAASVGLLWQGFGLGAGRLALGAELGGAFIWGFRQLVGEHEGLVIGRLAGADALGLGFAAGAMIWMVFTELLPEALHEAPRRSLALGGGVSFALMLAAQLLLFGT